MAIAADNDIELVLQASVKGITDNVANRVAAYYLNDKPLLLADYFSETLLYQIAKSMALANLMGQRRSLLSVGLSPRKELPLVLDRYSEIRRLVEHEGILQELEKLQLGFARQIYSDLYQIGANADAKVRFMVAQVAAKGLPKRKALQTIKQGLNKLGVTKSNPHQIKTLYETAIALAYGKGRWDRDHTPKVWKLFWGYEYVTMRDDRVRPTHRQLDRITLPKQHEFWATHWPPNGWNCRCQVVQIKRARKQYKPKDIPPPDDGFEDKNFANPLNLDK